MKRKTNFEAVSYWQAMDTAESEPSFLEEHTYEELWPEDLSVALNESLSDLLQVFLKVTPSGNIVFTSAQGQEVYQVTVPDLKKSSFLRRFLEYAEATTVLSLERKEMSGNKYNKMVFEEKRGSDEDVMFLDRDCPSCGDLLEKPRYKNTEIPEVITCSNYSCQYLDDSKTNYSINEKYFKEQLKSMQKEGYMEITGPTKDKFLKEQTPEEKKCEECSCGEKKVENVFIRKEEGELLYSWFNKCNRCHKYSTTSQLSKNDPLAIAAFGLIGEFEEE